MLTVTQAAERLGVSNETLYNWYESGKINIIFESEKRRLVSLEEVERIEANKIPDGMKRCKDCGKLKLKAVFMTGRNICKECQSEYEKLAWSKKKYSSNQQRRDRYKNNKEQQAINDRKYKYNITQDEYIQMLQDSDNTCSICDNNIDRLCVDHDHFTGKVRGLICHKCNFGLGHFNDSVLNLQQAISYLNYHHDQKSYCGYFYGGC